MKFAEWLDNNQHILKGRPVDEIAHLGILCDFQIDEISSTLPTWHMDQLTRTTHRQREQYFVDREIKTLAHFRGNPNLESAWFDLYRYENGRTW